MDNLPILDENGWPAEKRGVVPSVPGLSLCGLAFQSSISSGLLPGVGRDAEYVVRRLAADGRSRERSLVTAR